MPRNHRRDRVARRIETASPFWRRSLVSLALAAAVLPVLSSPLTPPEIPDAATGLRAALPAALETLSALSDVPNFVEEAAASADAAGGDRPLYIRDAGARIPAAKGGRVAPMRLATVQARFAAGRLVDPAGLLRSGIAIGDREMRTALAGPHPWSEPTVLAGNFRSPADPAVSASAKADRVLVASVAPVAGPAAAASDASGPSRNAVETLAAYAPAAAPAVPSLFDAVLGRKADGFVPPIGKRDHSWAATMLPASALSAGEQTCLATGIYFEARGESDEGQAAVAQVILNRVRNPSYPKTICGVVYQNAGWRNRCQFSFACDGIKDVVWNKRAYAVAERIADAVTKGETWLPEVGSATHYHATYVHPRWARAMEKVDRIGLHVFYRTFGGGWK